MRDRPRAASSDRHPLGDGLRRAGHAARGRSRSASSTLNTSRSQPGSRRRSSMSVARSPTLAGRAPSRRAARRSSSGESCAVVPMSVATSRSAAASRSPDEAGAALMRSASATSSVVPSASEKLPRTRIRDGSGTTRAAQEATRGSAAARGVTAQPAGSPMAAERTAANREVVAMPVRGVREISGAGTPTGAPARKSETAPERAGFPSTS